MLRVFDKRKSVKYVCIIHVYVIFCEYNDEFCNFQYLYFILLERQHRRKCESAVVCEKCSRQRSEKLFTSDWLMN